MKCNRSQNAFSLVEVTVALGIAAFCLIAIFGLLPTGMTSNKSSIEQTAAVNLLTAIDADLRSTPASIAQSSQFRIPVSAAGGPTTKFISEDGQLVASADEARYLLSIWMRPPASDSKQATTARLLITWPAQADIVDAVGSVETVVALDRN